MRTQYCVHIECATCKKDIPAARWIYYPERFEKVPYCAECYPKAKEKADKVKPKDADSEKKAEEPMEGEK